MKSGIRIVYSPAQLSSRIARLGRSISRDYAGRTLDVVILLESAFFFSADLLRRITPPVVCHFLRSELREVNWGGYSRREVFFAHPPPLRGRDVLVVDAVLHSGVTQDFFVKRLLEARPRSLRLAVLVDKPQERKVDLKPDYFGFVCASKTLVGYGLAGSRGWYRNLPYLGLLPQRGRRQAARLGRRVHKPAGASGR